MPSTSARLVWAMARRIIMSPVAVAVGRLVRMGFMRFRDMAVHLLYSGVYTTTTSVCHWLDGRRVTWKGMG